MQEENAFHHQISKLKQKKSLLKTKFETKKVKIEIRTFGSQFYLISICDNQIIIAIIMEKGRYIYLYF